MKNDAPLLKPRFPWLLIAPALAFVVLAAHFHRAGQTLASAAALTLLAVLTLPRPWAARIVQAALALAALEWLRAAVTLIALRLSLGQPYLRLALILGTVALLTAACLLVFRKDAVRRYFGLGMSRPA
ncbi:MAG: hypothetical protein ACK5TK_16945 [Betaproteobacteria bacterium]